MTSDCAVGLFLGLASLVYLLVALLRPEDFA
ncbi:potassium-transporting ATPase subunit F [Corynebacterium lowii]|nr:potassium-transporting ATPase subunit F [Corynebacterium lowii]MDP9852716.1 K+-transporting ATPase KdpF subunit [Corynebacterium lowii]